MGNTLFVLRSKNNSLENNMPYTLKRIREMLGKIKPQPWTFEEERTVDNDVLSDGILWSKKLGICIPTVHASCHDMNFIAAAPSIISQLLEEREEMKKKINDLLDTPEMDEDYWQRGFNRAIRDVLALFNE